MDIEKELEQASLMFDPEYQKQMALMDDAVAALDQSPVPTPDASGYPSYFDDRLLKIIDAVTLE